MTACVKVFTLSGCAIFFSLEIVAACVKTETPEFLLHEIVWDIYNAGFFGYMHDTCGKVKSFIAYIESSVVILVQLNLTLFLRMLQ